MADEWMSLFRRKLCRPWTAGEITVPKPNKISGPWKKKWPDDEDSTAEPYEVLFTKEFYIQRRSKDKTNMDLQLIEEFIEE